MVYAEWVVNGEFENGIFRTYGELFEVTFSPDIEILLIREMR